MSSWKKDKHRRYELSNAKTLGSDNFLHFRADSISQLTEKISKDLNILHDVLRIIICKRASSEADQIN